jgi:hypothetical protein
VDAEPEAELAADAEATAPKPARKSAPRKPRANG